MKRHIIALVLFWLATFSVVAALIWARQHDNAVVAVRDIARVERYFHDYGLILPSVADPVSALVRRDGRAFEVATFDVGEAKIRTFMEEVDGKYRLTVRSGTEREKMLSKIALAFAAAGVPFLSEADRKRCQAAETQITDSSVYFVSVSDTGKVFRAIVYDGALPE